LDNVRQHLYCKILAGSHSFVSKWPIRPQLFHKSFIIVAKYTLLNIMSGLPASISANSAPWALRLLSYWMLHWRRANACRANDSIREALHHFYLLHEAGQSASNIFQILVTRPGFECSLTALVARFIPLHHLVSTNKWL